MSDPIEEAVTENILDSILLSVNKQLGIEPEYRGFDNDTIPCINTALDSLIQLGFGPQTGFSITSKNEKWTDLDPNINNFSMVRAYVYLNSKLLFDPPTSSTVMEVVKEKIKEYEWKIQTRIENENGGN